MIAYAFRQIKKRAYAVEKNRSDHFNTNVQCTTCLRNVTRRQALKLTSTAEHPRHHFLFGKIRSICVAWSRAMNAVEESLPLPIWTQSAGEEVANGVSHGIGLVGAMIGTPILLLAALHHGNIPFFIGTIIFTTTMLLVYLASTLYHCWPRTHTKSLLQVLDHSAIFY